MSLCLADLALLLFEAQQKVFISAAIMCSQMSQRKDPSSVRIREVLLEMRNYRMGLIQTADQLRFSYLAVIEGARYIMGDTSIQVI